MYPWISTRVEAILRLKCACNNYSIRNYSNVFREARINLLTNKLACHHNLVFACKKSHVCMRRRFIISMIVVFTHRKLRDFVSNQALNGFYCSQKVTFVWRATAEVTPYSVPTLFFRFVKSTLSSFEWSKPHVSMLPVLAQLKHAVVLWERLLRFLQRDRILY